MATNTIFLPPLNGLSRRRFVTGAATGVGAAALLGLGGCSAHSRHAVTASAGASAQERMNAPVLRGNYFELNIGYQMVNFTGRNVHATTVNGSLPAPTLIWREGERVTIRVKNNLAVDTSIHWHGIILPTEMDGVPGLSFAGIKPGETFEYSFDVKQSGTYWYHSHSGHQEQTGLFGAIIIHAAADSVNGDADAYDCDHVITLSDWSDEHPHAVYAKLKKQPHYYNPNERTLNDLYAEIKQKGVAASWVERSMWNQMRMNDRDLADVTGWTYTFLMNGNTPANGWLGLFNNGDKVRLRFINAAAMTIFDVRIPGLKMTVVASDGQALAPVTVDEFRIGVAETYDVIVEPDSDMAYTLFAQAIDRSGYARGTLAADPALLALIPDFDPLPLLTHTDMGMSHAGMGTSAGSSHEGHTAASAANAGGVGPINHAVHTASSMNGGHSMHGDHSMHGGHSMPMTQGANKPVMGSGLAGFGSAKVIQHAATEFGPHVDMRAEMPLYRLDDPGVGLRDHQQLYGRRVLTYADLRNRYKTLDSRQPEREIELHLTGNMSRYMWSIDGIGYADAEPIRLRYGERIRITLVNDTMMNHPMHLHGMWSELETGDADYIPRKHTVIVQPGSKISYLVTADAKGRWAYHCHLLYHMMSMFREVTVS